MSLENNVKVTKIRNVVNFNYLKAFVDIVVCKFLVVKNCKVIEGEKGLFVSLPQEPGAKDGRWYPINKPYNKEAYKEIKDAVLAAYDAETKKLATV